MDLIKLRLLIETSTDDILVNEYRGNRISCLVDNDNDAFPDERLTFADQSNKLSLPYGMAFYNNYFYVANRNDIRRYLYINGSQNIQGKGELLVDLDPNDYWTRSLLFLPKNRKMFIGIGSLTDHDNDPLPKASVQIANFDETNQTTLLHMNFEIW